MSDTASRPHSSPQANISTVLVLPFTLEQRHAQTNTCMGRQAYLAGGVVGEVGVPHDEGLVGGADPLKRDGVDDGGHGDGGLALQHLPYRTVD